jgi:hypothetical protein
MIGLDLQEPGSATEPKQTGPIAACCGKPYKQCTCARPVESMESIRVPQTPEHRTARALERIVLLLEAMTGTKAPDVPEPAIVPPVTGTPVDQIRARHEGAKGTRTA